MIRRIIPSVASLLLLTCCGCSETLSYKAATYRIGAAPVGQQVIKPGVYRVNWTAHKSLHSLAGTDRFVNAGQFVGFETAADGRVYAYAGADRLDLGPLPAKAHTLVWQHQEAHT